MEGSARPRVLLVAFACAPGRGSEPGAGWTWMLGAAEHHDVWLLTSDHQRDRLDAALAEHRPPGLRAVHYVEDDVPRLRRSLPSRLHRPGRYRGNSQWHYWRWQRAARQLQAHGHGRGVQGTGLGVGLAAGAQQQAHAPGTGGVVACQRLQASLHGSGVERHIEMRGRALQARQVLPGDQRILIDAALGG